MQKKHAHVFIAGTFDLFHIGHQWFLWQGVSRAEQGTIIIARDETVHHIKGFSPTHTQDERLHRLKKEFQNHPHISIKIGAPHSAMMDTLREANPDLLFLGYDQYAPREAIRKEFPHIHIETCTPYAPEFFKSSHFR